MNRMMWPIIHAVLARLMVCAPASCGLVPAREVSVQAGRVLEEA